MAKYVYRIDDVHSKMDFEVLEKYLFLFDKYKVVPLLGVIPNNEDKSLIYNNEKDFFWSYIKEKVSSGKIDIAMHGYNHVYETKNGGLLGSKYGFKNQSEFAGLEYTKQKCKLDKGIKILNDNELETDIFMAPSHSFDNNTVNALVESGFKYITDGIALYPFDYKGVRFLPNIFGKPRQFPFGVITICLHPSSEDTETLRAVENHIKSNKCISFRQATNIKPTKYGDLINFLFSNFYRLIRLLK